MNKQVKIKINGKDYYCDSEILKLIMRNQDKIEALEYNRDKTIEYIEHEWFKRQQLGITRLDFSYEELQDILSILRGEE